MNQIFYNHQAEEIQFEGNISSFVFYTQFFDAVNDHYNKHGLKKVPRINFECVNHFDSQVLPNLLGIGLILKRIHGAECKIPLKISRVSSTKFLDSSGFFDNVGKEHYYTESVNENLLDKKYLSKRGLDIYDFDPKMLGFYNDEKFSNKYNSEHKLHVYADNSFDYYKLFNELNGQALDESLSMVRSNKYNMLKPFIEKHFFRILYKQYRSREQTDIILNALTEIICNATLYSGSLSVAMMQFKNDRTNLSISDFGVGFEYSFNVKPSFNYSIKSKFNAQAQVRLKNLLLIFEALNYSMNNKRENLYTLVDTVVKSDGKIRIHYNDTQVVFTGQRCKNCDKIDPPKCINCLLKSFNSDQIISPLRFYKNILQGVHIEVEFNF